MLSHRGNNYSFSYDSRKNEICKLHITINYDDGTCDIKVIDIPSRNNGIMTIMFDCQPGVKHLVITGFIRSYITNCQKSVYLCTYSNT